MVNKCSTSTEQKSRAQKISEAEGRAVKMARRVGGGLAALPLKYSSNFFVKRPQVVKQKRCARRRGGRGERIKASQQEKFEAAAENE